MIDKASCKAPGFSDKSLVRAEIGQPVRRVRMDVARQQRMMAVKEHGQLADEMHLFVRQYITHALKTLLADPAKPVHERLQRFAVHAVVVVGADNPLQAHGGSIEQDMLG